MANPNFSKIANRRGAMGGGMRRPGYKKGSNGKPISKSKNPGLVKLAKIALQAGAKIYSNKQKTKMAMSDAQLMHAEKMARGEESYQGKLLEARQNDYKDEFVLVIISAPIVVLMWAVMSDDPTAMEKVKLFFEYFHELPKWFTNLWVLVVASIFGIKGTQIFRNGGKK